MEYYLLVKDIHITTAILSLFGFSIRAWWMFSSDDLLHSKIVKIAPHINDTVLLSAAIYLSVMSEMYPFAEGWLGAKVLLLIGYIVAGTVALKKGKTRETRIIAFWLALACVGTIFYLALARPLIFA
ncbi:MAG: SirB2 family protein [Kangiellaceae bacterium]|nr:SirB2 family protein [Kangiellaceae bacterium]